MITEYGGVKAEEQGAEGWGYGEAAKSFDEMLERIAALTNAILEEEEICGYCYTPVSYTHLDVYKRQVFPPAFAVTVIL